MNVRDFLLENIKRPGVVQANVARAAGISRQYLHGALLHDRYRMSFNMVARLCNVFGYKLVAIPMEKKVPNGSVELEVYDMDD